MTKNARRLTVAIAVLMGASALDAAVQEKSLADATGRRKAAENRLSMIKQKSPQLVDEAKARYTDAATANNAWVDRLCDGIEAGGSPAPELLSLAESAATSLVAWANVASKALDVPEMSASIAEGTKKQVVQSLIEIGTKASRGGDANKRKKSSAELRTQLRWKAFDEVQ